MEWETLDRPPSYREEMFVQQVLSSTYPTGIFEEVSAMAMLETNVPTYFHRNLRNLITLAEEHGIPVVLMTFARCPEFDKNPRAWRDEFVYGIDEHNEIIRELSDYRGCRVYDLAWDMPLETQYFTDGFHCNAKGHALRAEMTAAYLGEEGLLPK